MSSTTRRPRALRPEPECLEGRRLLSKTVTGTDVDGDTWVLKLAGPGDLRVTKQNGADGNPTALDAKTLISTITVAGADPNATRLYGTVAKAAGGDGKVFFANLTEVGGPALNATGDNGLLSIDMPNFWLGDTNPGGTVATGAARASINVPDGVASLRFGGADTTAFFGTTDSQRLTQNGVNDTFLINLGLPKAIGTSVIVDKFISSGQAGAASSTGTPGTPTQNSITVNVAGRVNLFQANSVEGTASIPTTGFSGGGGTLLVSNADARTGVSGEIGQVRIGGNATNFSTQSIDKVSSYFVGGEATNVQLLSPGGSRNVVFGRGMDTVTILTHNIETLRANRGALNSTVIAEREIAQVQIGGDVSGTQIESGYQINPRTIFQNQSAPTTVPNAQAGGGMTVLIAGSVTNSVFAASVQPDVTGAFGTNNDLFFPFAHIKAKVEGTIDNTTETPDSPTTAFYAKSVDLKKGPVTPPNVPEAPYPKSALPPRSAVGLRGGASAKGVVVAAATPRPTRVASHAKAKKG